MVSAMIRDTIYETNAGTRLQPQPRRAPRAKQQYAGRRHDVQMSTKDGRTTTT